ncbi:MAG TPA: ABC transporter ATP-binding protein [Candidatus Limnocylindria bacterium]|nr:ABC transporter ATP-binding protein [Candidatus Limnocylindria bacterium]
MIRVSELVKIYQTGGVRAVDDVSFTVEEGEFYTLLGPSGCGKTTTLRCIAGLERANGGTIELGDTVVVSDRVYVPPYRRDIGMVFQSYAVWPHMTVFENVAFPLRVGRDRPSGSSVKEKVETALGLVGLGSYEDRMATQLSGGQQQRLSLARAIVREPKVLLLDEPLSNLDARLRERMRGELTAIQRRLGVTTLFVTHDQIEALSMSDRIAVMDGGRIVQEGTPEQIYHEPVNEFVASFIGSTNLFLGTFVARNEGARTVTVDLAFGRLDVEDPEVPVEPGGQVIVAIRPENVVLHHDGHDAVGDRPNVVDARIGIGLFTGNSMEYYIEVEGNLVQVRADSRLKLDRGDPVKVEMRPFDCRIFPVHGQPLVRVGSRRLSALARVDA